MLSFRGGLNPSARLDATLTPIQGPEVGGLFCHESLELPAGPHTIRLQVMLPKRAGRQEITLTASSESQGVLATARLDTSHPEAPALADAMTLSFVLPESAHVTVEGSASAHARMTHLRFLTQAPVSGYEGHEERFRFFPEFDLTGLVPKSVIFGTTAVCNANCFHCPTNKAYSKTQAKGFMDMALFERIVDELAEIGFSGGVVFGLFGDPLSDPLFLERIRLVRQRLPGAIICPSTNAGVYDSAKHAEALSYADDVVVHVEGVTSEVYDASMRPLKLARTRPRVEQLIEDRQGKPVRIISPVHRRNLHEMGALRDLWEGRGAGATFYSYLMNRGGQADAYEDAALAPTATGCSPTILADLVIDWDGAVVTCCQDFHRRTIIGNLTRESVREVLTNADRRRTVELLNDKRWNAIETCASCKNDCEASVLSLVSEQLKASDAHRVFTPREFQAKGRVDARPDRFLIQSRRSVLDQLRAPLGTLPRATIFGPYKPLYSGRYRLTFDIADIQAELRARIAIEIDAPSGRLAGRKLRGRDLASAISIDIEVPAYVPLEFRVRAQGVDFEFRGVTSERIEDATATATP